jgi:hypothetical protein
MPVGAPVVAERCRSRIAAEWIGQELRIINDVRVRRRNQFIVVARKLSSYSDASGGRGRHGGGWIGPKG